MGFVDKKRVIRAILRKIWLIILVTVLTAGLSFGITRFLITPKYEANAKFYVNNSPLSVGGASLSISASEITAAQSLVETYIVILNSRMTLTEVIDLAGLDCTYEQLREMVSASSVNDTEIFEVIVTHTDPVLAKNIANTIAVILPEKIAAVVDGSSVRVVDYAVLPERSADPGVVSNTALGMLFGAVCSITLVIFGVLLDNKIRSEEYLTANYAQIPLLAVIPDTNAAKGSGYYKQRHTSNDAPRKKAQ